MSETEYHRGKLKPLRITLDGRYPGDDDTAAEYLASYVLDKALIDLELPDWCTSWVDWYRDEVSDVYYIRHAIIYEILEEDTNPYEDVYNARPNGDGTIDFDLRFYNGGCSFQEALEYALEEIGK